MRPIPFAAVAVLLTTQEPAARSPGNPTARFDGDVTAISGVFELPDGRLLLSDFREPALYLVDLRTHSSSRISRPGSGPNEYQQPGGIYLGTGDTVLVLDRQQARVLLVTPNGRVAGMRSVAVQGTSGSSDLDVDRTRLDAVGTPHFLDPNSAFGIRRGRPVDSVPLWRFDPVRQRADTVAQLRQPETRIISAEGNVVRSQRVLFSPADGWAVAPDGRVAVIRSEPYRIEWITRDGRVVRGPEIDYVPVPVSRADRDAVTGQGGGRAGVGAPGGVPKGSLTGVAPIFADTKPAFDPDDIIVAPNGYLWVGRTMPATAATVVYDVFDARGERIDRIALPARSRVVGFGTGAVYVSERDAEDLPHLRKYSIR